MADLQQQELLRYSRNVRLEMCEGRCSYAFQPVQVENKVVSSQDGTPEKNIEIVTKGCLFCQTCAHTVDVEFGE